jgi:hypothetical protein
VVVDDLDILGIAVFEAKAQASLVIDANTVLPAAISVEGLEPIARRYAQIIEGGGGIELP